MEFAIHHLVFTVYQLKCMRTIAVHVAITIGYAAIAEKKHNLMRRFGSERNKVPEHVSILE